MRYSCCVPGCKSNYKKDEPSVTVIKFPGIGELRQQLLQHIHRKFDQITQSTRVCIKYLKTKMCMVLTFTQIPMELLIW